MKGQLRALEERNAEAEPLTRVQLIQLRMDLQTELASRQGTVDLGALEEEVVRAARAYGERKGISYAPWREAGVEPAVLRRAGITRAGG